MAIQNYIFCKKYSFEAEVRERIIFMSQVECAYEQVGVFKPKTLVLTNVGVHIFRPPGSKPCSVCPPENLCPSGPLPDRKFQYDRITDIIFFPLLPQKMVIEYHLSQNMLASNESKSSLSIILPGLSDAQKMYEVIVGIMSEQKDTGFLED